MADLFADFFSSIYRVQTTPTPSYEYSLATHLSSIHISACDVENKLKSLDASKSPGPDDIPAAVLKFCSEVMAPHLAIHFNRLLAKGVFPANLKSGFLIPIHKSGDMSSVKNYRPVVIQSCLAKVFESVVLENLTFSFKNIITTRQHGFQRGRSTSTNLVVFINNILNAFKNRNQLDCIYLDFAKAFDRVSHAHLIKKVEALGLSGSLLSWLHSYLIGRSLRVRYASALSRLIEVPSGVPQGSHLGPFLFSLFVNDIGEDLDGDYLLFADDVKLFREIASYDDQLSLQEDLGRIEVWCLLNDMDLNLSKCQVITFSRSKQTLDFNYLLQDIGLGRVGEVGDLGVILSSNLDPGSHISKTCSKALRTLGFIYRTCRQGLSASSLRTLYVSLVRPIMEFSVVTWNPYQVGQCSSLDAVQRRLVRLMGVMLGFNYLEVNIQEMEQYLSLPSLATRRTIADLIFLFKVLNNDIDCPEILHLIDFHVPRVARHSQLFTNHHHSTNYLYYSAIPRLTRIGNAVCEEVDFLGSSLSAFRRDTALAVRSVNFQP